MGQCYITRRGTKTGGAVEQLGVYPTGNNGRPIGNVTVLDNVTNLGIYLFKDNSGVTGVALPNSLRTIEDQAFQNCTNLQDIAIPNKISVIPTGCFENNTSLSKVKLPESLTEIKGYAFNGCTNLFDIFIPDAIGSLIIGKYAFQGCHMDNETATKLAVNVNKTIYSYAFAGIKDVSEITTSMVWDYYFQNCTSLKKCTILKVNNSNFGQHVFNGCSSIETVILPDEGTAINQNMFSNLPSLKNVNIPKNCKTIGSQAFYKCTKLTELYIWDKIETIANNSFRDCTNLKSIYIDKLRGSITEPADRWGAVNSTVYYNNPIIRIVRQLPDIAVYINEQYIEDKYEVPKLGNVVCTAYHKDYLPSAVTISAAETNHTYDCEPVMSDQDGYRLTLNITNDNPQYRISYDGIHTFKDGSVLVPKGAEVTYTAAAYQSEPTSGTVTVTEDTVLNISLNPRYWENIILQYPFKDYTFSDIDYLSNLGQFEISENYISNKSTPHNGASYGYIQFRTPTSDNYTENMQLKISCYVSSENSHDWGGIWAGTEIWQPTLSEIRNNTSHSGGQWLFRSSGISITSPQEYTMTLNADTEYYINLAYAKDGSDVSGSDKMFISRIEFITSA